MDIREITTEELSDKINRNEDFKLVMTFHEGGYRAKHIPGSLNIHPQEIVAGLFDPADEIVVYCVNKQCIASLVSYRQFESMGFKNIRRYTGGLEDWEAAGFTFEGNDTGKKIEVGDDFSGK